MIDRPDRKKPRFPPGKESAVAAAIHARLSEMLARMDGMPAGIAGGACGSDILFHEQCLALGIPAEMYLALPPGDFVEQSVSFAGAGWKRRFEELCRLVPVHVMTEELSRMAGKGNIWERVNLWMLSEGMDTDGRGATLLAVWDGKRGDDLGGTEDMITTAERRGAKTEIIDIRGL